MKQNAESQMTRTAKASVLCGGLIVIAGCISVFAPQLQMPALAFLFALNTGLHFAVWKRSVRRGQPMGATLSITLAEAWFLLVLVVFFAVGKPSADLVLAAYAFYQVTHGSSLLTIPTGLSRALGACNHWNQYPAERRGKTDHGVGKPKRSIQSQQKPDRTMRLSR